MHRLSARRSQDFLLDYAICTAHVTIGATCVPFDVVADLFRSWMDCDRHLAVRSNIPLSVKNIGCPPCGYRVYRHYQVFFAVSLGLLPMQYHGSLH
jgi:hypothetical protein